METKPNNKRKIFIDPLSLYKRFPEIRDFLQTLMFHIFAIKPKVPTL